VPVIIVTAHTSNDYRHAAEEAGCTAFLSKPADPHDLVDELRRVLARA
jgi:DNA-binding NarL/FixJ family response regulator